MKKTTILIAVAALMGFASCNSSKEENSKEVNVYTHRHYDVDDEIFKRFTEETGIKVNVVSASADELIMKLKQEGELSQADLLFTVDAGKIERAKADGLLQVVKDDTLSQRLLDRFSDPENYWYGFSLRARIIAAAKTVENPESITYASLASEQFANRVLMRSADNVYNQSLIASVIAHHGKDSALAWLTNVHDNLARDPKGNDRDQVRAVAAGEGDITVVNSYYIGKMANSGEARDSIALSKVNFIFPADKDLNTHVNLSAGGMCKHAPNQENALALLRFMAREDIQALFYSMNQEYAANNENPQETEFSFIGSFVPDNLPFAKLGEHQQEAVELLESVNWK